MIYVPGLSEQLGGTAPPDAESEEGSFGVLKGQISDALTAADFAADVPQVSEAINSAKGVVKDVMNTPPPATGDNMSQQPTQKPTMPMVDFNFLKEVEGTRSSVYVPTSKGQVIESSGATIASGFDLGQHNASDLKSFGFSPELTAKLTPYLGKKKQAALNFVKANPLKLSDDEVSEINRKVKTKKIGELADAFNLDSDIKFRELPPQMQTAIASVAFQYGIGGVKKFNFWKQITSGDYEAALKNLRNFGDKYPSRRKKEAILFEGAMDSLKQPNQLVEHEGKQYQVVEGKLVAYEAPDEVYYDDNGDKFRMVNGQPEKIA